MKKAELEASLREGPLDALTRFFGHALKFTHDGSAYVCTCSGVVGKGSHMEAALEDLGRQALASCR